MGLASPEMSVSNNGSVEIMECLCYNWNFHLKRKARESVESIGRYSNFHGQLLMSAMLLVVAIILKLKY